MSYENLKEDDDKAIFLLSALFPYDFDIHTEDLLRYGWGSNFFKDVKTLPIARRHMKICVNNLIRANLLIESDQMGCVKMHDLVRAFVLSNFSKVKQASIVNHDNMSALTKDTNKSYERILLKCTGMLEFPTDFIYPKLSLLILMDGNNLLNIRKIFTKE
ncbi:putative winged helix-like DNA-binding domain superfamily [Helianthus annuus]|nr:putative winged helix-like DNA-binding domain superfamily [Helianthus annuus]